MPVPVIFGTILFLIVTPAWFIRRYIRRALELERIRYGHLGNSPIVPEVTSRVPILETMVQPLREGVVDLRALRNGPQISQAVFESTHETAENISARQFVAKYKLFFAFIFVVVVLTIGLSIYFTTVLVKERTYNIKDVSA